MRKTSIPQKPFSSDFAVRSFGGSTVWGTGARDHETFPSFLAINHQFFSENFGESAYIARQSLAYLINLYVYEKRPKDMIYVNLFYDGYNDIVSQCRSEVEIDQTERGNSIRAVLNNKDSHLAPFKNTTVTFKKIANMVTDKDAAFFDRLYVCDNDEVKARAVARSLIETWKLAWQISIANGDEFMAVLHPTALFDGNNYTHINLDSSEKRELKKQIQKVQPIIQSMLNEQPFFTFDLTNKFEGNPEVYIDPAHLTPEGNEIIADALARQIFELMAD